MLNTILILLVILWLLGMVSSYTLGGFIHLLLVLAVALMHELDHNGLTSLLDPLRKR